MLSEQLFSEYHFHISCQSNSCIHSTFARRKPSWPWRTNKYTYLQSKTKNKSFTSNFRPSVFHISLRTIDIATILTLFENNTKLMCLSRKFLIRFWCFLDNLCEYCVHRIALIYILALTSFLCIEIGIADIQRFNEGSTV